MLSWAEWGFPSPLAVRMTVSISRFSLRVSFRFASGVFVFDNRLYLLFQSVLPCENDIEIIRLIGSLLWMASRKNGSMTSIMQKAAALFPALPLSKKKSGTPISTAGVKQSSCLFVRLKSTLLFTLVRSFDGYIGQFINSFRNKKGRYKNALN